MPMASSFDLKNTMLSLALVLVLSMQGALGAMVTCEKLGKEACAFAVSSFGKRCVLEKRVRRSGKEVFECRTSEIETENLKDWIETNQCVKACGLDRNSLGISSDSLLDSHFTQKLCSTECYGSCPNVVDLYSNLAAGEGVFLPDLCQTGVSPRRAVSELLSSGIVAPGPVSADIFAAAPSPY